MRKQSFACSLTDTLFCLIFVLITTAQCLPLSYCSETWGNRDFRCWRSKSTSLGILCVHQWFFILSFSSRTFYVVSQFLLVLNRGLSTLIQQFLFLSGDLVYFTYLVYYVCKSLLPYFVVDRLSFCLRIQDSSCFLFLPCFFHIDA